ncbi:LysR family transcriptional regulator [Sulfitobacter sp. M57]|uniref:LysR substrate-binding domain-containing protein n=1 Tax=unclassified Sulfitobacter TaxID=196795 RepID=UPI0023E0BC1C|nr:MULTISPECIES: LysR substrate-binding domain-containing protein [unclassified Sulfitobacter]MDF3415691.1 LysR family transcriptional regulator [Sulfitobacter sp. KE5]MDF3423171.1 LysR family transcriptional regulator [Sulfitobacter sp. KE43]MDF3434237.1 LysR family transcriptional regulator [Sulfitobacter sp. KE42]MDF3459730.1 LysR family transcriptional regulator [Sulfitobacter sp. S74]MDF3463775.1 LysR family transcriptional regulator [Sulfitobacter sp. Ks18]
MIAPRRFLPSISALLAFEAVARLGSATAAAQELSLTQSAVSRQLKTLEEQLDVALIIRKGRQLALTKAGQTYVVQVREILNRLGQASVSLRTNPTGGSLNLAILPAFGMHWLAPRLRDFARAHPEVTVNLSTRLRPFAIADSPFDAAIHFGHEDWPGVQYLPLMPETVVPVCAPDLLDAPLTQAQDMLSHPLLHLETRPRGWARWLAALGVTADPPAGMVFDQFSTMAQAAIHGLGVALLPTFFADPYLRDGQLILASAQTTQSIGNYYLVWPQDRDEGAALTSFRTWLTGQAQTDDPDPEEVQ